MSAGLWTGILLLIALFCQSVPAPAQTETRPTTRPQEVDWNEIRSSSESILKVHARIEEALGRSGEAAREELRRIVAEPDARPNVVVAAGWALAETNDRSALGDLIKAAQSGRFEKSQLDDFKEQVLRRYHESSSVLPRLTERAKEARHSLKELERILDLCVYAGSAGAEAAGGGRRAAIQRSRALEALIAAYSDAKTAFEGDAAKAVRAALTRLSGGHIDLPDAASWAAWYEKMRTFRGADDGITVEDVLAAVVADQRNEIQALKGQVLGITAQLVRNLASDTDRVPVDYLVDGVDEIRRVTLDEIVRRASSFNETARVAGVKRCLALLEKSDVKSPAFDALVRAAAALGGSLFDADETLRIELCDWLLSGDRIPAGGRFDDLYLDAALALGVLPDSRRVTAIYQDAKDDDTEAQRALRRKAIRAAQLCSGSVRLLVGALNDKSAEVRTAAAVGLEALKEHLATTQGADRPVDALVAAAVVESEKSVRRRMFESTALITRGQPESLGAEAARRLADCIARTNGADAEDAAAALRYAVELKALPPETVEALVTVVAPVFSAPKARVSKDLVEFFAVAGNGPARTVLGEWLVGQEEGSPAFASARAAVLEGGTAELLWSVAEGFARKESAAALREAAAFARKAAEASGDDSERADWAMVWTAGSDAPAAERQEAYDAIARKATQRPENLRLLVLRARAAEGIGRLQDAERDLSEALQRGGSVQGLSDAGESARRLAKVRFQLGRFAEAGEALDRVPQADRRADDARLRVWIRILGAERGNGRKSEALESDEAQSSPAVQAALLTAAALLSRDATERSGEADRLLKGEAPASRPRGESAAQVWRGFAEVAREADAALAAGDDAAALPQLKRLAVDSPVAVAYAIAAAVERGRTFDADPARTLNEIFGELAPSAGVFARLAETDAKSGAAELWSWALRLPLSPKILRACLNG